MPCHYLRCHLHHRHCPQHQSALPPLLLSSPLFPLAPTPRDPPWPPPLAPNHDSTDPTSRTPIARWKAKTYGAAKAAKFALPPTLPPQYSLNMCAIAVVATATTLPSCRQWCCNAAAPKRQGMPATALSPCRCQPQSTPKKPLPVPWTRRPKGGCRGRRHFALVERHTVILFCWQFVLLFVLRSLAFFCQAEH
jgi:hypothetical protein